MRLQFDFDGGNGPRGGWPFVLVVLIVAATIVSVIWLRVAYP